MKMNQLRVKIQKLGMAILEAKPANALHIMANIRKQYAGIGYTYDAVAMMYL
jgi:hypothetical protein